MKKKILFLFIILFTVTSVFAYGDISGAEYAGKDYEIDLNSSITRLKNEWIRTNNSERGENCLQNRKTYK